jgi:hypothetical protein
MTFHFAFMPSMCNAVYYSLVLVLVVTCIDPNTFSLLLRNPVELNMSVRGWRLSYKIRTEFKNKQFPYGKGTVYVISVFNK